MHLTSAKHQSPYVNFAAMGRPVQIKRNGALGRSAEDLVARKYLRSGFTLRERNWQRFGEGELDLIFSHERSYYFVEVKSSQNHEMAARHLTQKQCRRMYRMAYRFLAEIEEDLDVAMRFDAAFVDQFGNVKVCPALLNPN